MNSNLHYVKQTVDRDLFMDVPLRKSIEEIVSEKVPAGSDVVAAYWTDYLVEWCATYAVVYRKAVHDG